MARPAIFIPIKTITAFCAISMGWASLSVLWNQPTLYVSTLIAVYPGLFLALDWLLEGTMLEGIIRRILRMPAEPPARSVTPHRPPEQTGCTDTPPALNYLTRRPRK